VLGAVVDVDINYYLNVGDVVIIFVVVVVVQKVAKFGRF
jgi:hypothetical protein